MKRISILLLILLAIDTSSKAQESLTLTFTANTPNGVYCPFDALNVTNVTRGWTETLTYPDTIYILNSHVSGLGEQQEISFLLGEAYPNPFTNETNVPMDMLTSEEVFIQVVLVDGTIVGSWKGLVEVGLHNVKVGLNTPSVAFLVVTSPQGGRVARMVCAGCGGGNSLVVETGSRVPATPNRFIQVNTTDEFHPGDLMRYTAVLFDGSSTIYSNTLSQQQYESETVSLLFDLTKPVVSTNPVINITQTTATGGGNVISTGGVMVHERGICWSTNHNPTINDHHANNGPGSGAFFVSMGGLLSNTTYYVRAYANNCLGIAYGGEESFSTSQDQDCDIIVSANPNGGGMVSGGGTYRPGDTCTVTAVKRPGFSFLQWSEDGEQVSLDPIYTFMVTRNRYLVAQFREGEMLSNEYLNNPLIGHPQIYRSDIISSYYVNINGYTATGNDTNTDLFHMYDELASTYPLFFRRTEDIVTVTDSQTGIAYTVRSYEMGYSDRWLIDHEPLEGEIITNTATNYWLSKGEEPRKILLVSGVHGEEHVPTWGLMLALQEILSSDEDWAHFIKDNFVFKIIPCLNPAGWSNCRRGNSVYDATANPPHYHILNNAESMDDPEAVAYLEWMEANKDAFILIDHHGTQGRYMYLPINYNLSIASMVHLLATKLSSTLRQNWHDFYENYQSGIGVTYAPYCIAKTNFFPPPQGSFPTRAFGFGLNYMTIETPDNLGGWGIDNNDLRCCKLTKDLILNILQIVCPLQSLGGCGPKSE